MTHHDAKTKPVTTFNSNKKGI